MGLGDALYLQSVVRHLVARGEKLKVLTEWPEVFRMLNGSVICAPFTRLGAPVVAHYTMRKGKSGTTQFKDCCIQAGIREDVELKLEWPRQSSPLVESIRLQSAGRPTVLVQMMRAPMNRKDQFGASLLPSRVVMQRCVDRLKERCHLVLVGAGQCVEQLHGLHQDLTNRTSVTELLDVAAAADGFLGYVSFFVPLAESLNKPAFMVWSSAGLADPQNYIKWITPEKVIHRKDLVRHVVDDWSRERIEEAVDAFLR